jgi:chromosome segregation ATPase
MEGLEKIASDLRIERSKATNALRDRARLRVENESLQQTLKEREDHVALLEESLQKLKEEVGDTKHSLGKVEVDYDKKNNQIARMKAELYEANEEKGRLASEHADMLSHYKELEQRSFTTKEENELLKGKLRVAEGMQRRMEAEASEVVILKNSLEEEHTVNLEKLREKSQFIESMKDRVAAAEALELSYRQLEAANEGLKAELDSAIQAESKLSTSARKYAREYTEKSIAREMLTEELARLKQEQGESRAAMRSLEQSNLELKGRIEAELEGHGFTKQRAESLQKSFDAARAELADTQRSLDDASQRNMDCESLLAKNKVQLKESREREAELRVSSDNVAALRRELVTAQKAAKEGEEARFQLFSLRKEMTKTALETSAAETSFASNGGGDASGSGSAQRYEAIITELNTDLTASDTKLQGALRDLSIAQQRIVELEKLSEELEITKAAAQELSVEKQASEASAADAAERSMRMLASKEGAVREVMALERELDQSKRELEYVRAELGNEKTRNKAVYAEKLCAERQVAEKMAVCARIEGELEAERNVTIEKEYELQRLRRREKELETAAESLRLTLWQLENRPEGGPVASVPVIWPTSDGGGDGGGDSSALRLQLEQAEHQLSLCHREIESLKENVKVQRAGFDNALTECSRLYEANRKLKRQVEQADGPAADGNLSMSMSASAWKQTSELSAINAGGTATKEDSAVALSSVRKELSHTMTDMENASIAAKHKSQLVAQLQAELEQEQQGMWTMQERFAALQDQESEITTGLPRPPSSASAQSVTDTDMLEKYTDRLLASGHIDLPSPVGMMQYSSPTLKQSKARLASSHLTKGGSPGPQSPDGKGPAHSSPNRRSSGVLPGSPDDHGSPMTAAHMRSRDGPTAESKEDEGAFMSRHSSSTLVEDIQLIKNRKTAPDQAEKASNHRRRLEVNHQRERALRKEAMQAVRKINRRQLQTGQVSEGQSASSSPMPSLKQILPHKTDLTRAGGRVKQTSPAKSPKSPTGRSRPKSALKK